MDHGLDIETRVRDGLLRLAKDLGICRWSPPTTRTTPTPSDADAHEAPAVRRSPARRMADPNRFKFDGDGYYLKSPAEMRALWDGKYDLRGGLRQHPADRRAVRRSSSTSPRTYMPRFPVPDGRDRGDLVRQGGRAGPAPSATPDGIPTEVRKQAEFEVGVIIQMGFPGYFLVVADFINWAKDNGIRVGPGRGSGAGLDRRLRDADHRPRPARARPDLRAVPQPRARLDARLRHRLRRAPARRGDPLRHREVRRRPGRADRHLRHHQGQAGGQGLRAGARLPVRDGRPDHQGDARRR